MLHPLLLAQGGARRTFKLLAALARNLPGGALVHDVDLSRPCGLNVVLLKAFLDAQAQLAAHSMLLVGPCLHLDQILHLTIAHAIYPWHFNVAHNIIGESWVISKVFAHVL